MKWTVAAFMAAMSVVSSLASAQSPQPAETVGKRPAEAKTVIHSAVKKARADKKTVFVHFSASW